MYWEEINHRQNPQEHWRMMQRKWTRITEIGTAGPSAKGKTRNSQGTLGTLVDIHNLLEINCQQIQNPKHYKLFLSKKKKAQM